MRAENQEYSKNVIVVVITNILYLFCWFNLKISLLITGVYECRLMRTDDKAFFRQKSATSFSLKTKPTITVSPIRQYVQCPGGSVALNCSVSPGYEVEFRDISAAGKPDTKTQKSTKGKSVTEKHFISQHFHKSIFNAINIIL